MSADNKIMSTTKCDNCINGYVKFYPNTTRALYDLIICPECKGTAKISVKLQ